MLGESSCPERDARKERDLMEILDMLLHRRSIRSFRPEPVREEDLNAILEAGIYAPSAKNLQSTKLVVVQDRETLALLERVNKIAQGAALMTETSVAMRQIDGTASILPNETLERVMYENMQQVPVPEYTAAEREFAEALHATYPAAVPGLLSNFNRQVWAYANKMTDGGKRAINDFIMPYVPYFAYAPGSTDVGDVSWLTPTAQITTATWTSASPGHSWQNVSIGRTSIAHKGVLQAAKIIAGSAADLMEQPELLEKARAEFDEAAAEGYDCPIGKEVTY